MPRDTLVAYLFRDEVSSSFHQSILELFIADTVSDNGRIIDGTWCYTATGEVPTSRNMTVQRLLNSDAEWLFMIDADMGFAKDILLQLHSVADATDRPVIGGLCFAQKQAEPDGRGGFRTQAKPTLYNYVQEVDGFSRYHPQDYYPVNEAIRCDATGGACLLVHRSVFTRIVREFGATWFDRERATDNALMGEDISFFDKCRQLDIPLHVHTGARTTHHKPVWLAEEDFWRDLPVPPATEAVDVIVPVLHRPQNVKTFMDSLKASTGLATAWFVCDRDDKVEQDAVLEHGGLVLKCDGSFARKVNYAYGKIEAPAPWVFLVGDDVRFRAGWLDHAEFVARSFDADVIGTNDLGNQAVIRGEHATHMLIRRSYIDQVGASWDGPGVVCHEGYRHWFVDNEIVLAAQKRAVWQMAIGSIVEHLHPLFGKGDDDDVYRLGQAAAQADREVFAGRFEEFAA